MFTDMKTRGFKFDTKAEIDIKTNKMGNSWEVSFLSEYR
jgi:hypothetical protein